jgi:hypothetical protein
LAFGIQRRRLKQAVAEITKKTGWIALGLFDEDVTEPYWISRFLLFERLKIQFRDQILLLLNAGLQRAGSRIGISSQIEVSGVPTEKEVDWSEAEIDEGNCSFKDIMAPFLLY